MANYDDKEFGKVAAGQEMLMSLGALIGPLIINGLFTVGFNMTGLEDCSIGSDKHYLEAALPWFVTAAGIVVCSCCLPLCKKLDPFTK